LIDEGYLVLFQFEIGVVPRAFLIADADGGEFRWGAMK